MELQNKDELKIIRVLQKADSYMLGGLKNRVRGFSKKSLDRLMSVGIVEKEFLGTAPNGKSADRYFLASDYKNISFELVEDEPFVDSIDRNVPFPYDLVGELLFAKIAYAMQVGDSYLDKSGSDDVENCESVVQIKKYGRECGYVFTARKVEGGIRIWRVA